MSLIAAGAPALIVAQLTARLLAAFDLFDALPM
jgi:hypothetical protein